MRMMRQVRMMKTMKMVETERSIEQTAAVDSATNSRCKKTPMKDVECQLRQVIAKIDQPMVNCNQPEKILSEKKNEG